jgi:hypothetical protein
MAVKRKASSTSGGAAKKTLRKTLSEEDASKKCRDNLKGYSDEQVYVVKNSEGVTAFDEVLAGVRTKKTDKLFPLCKIFYKQVRERHPKIILNQALLVVPNPPGHVHPGLLRAMVATRKAKADHTQVLSWLAANTPTTTTEIIGLTRWMLSLNPKSIAHSTAAQAFVRFCSRVDAATKWPAYYEAFWKQYANDVVVAAWKKASGISQKVKPSVSQFCADNLTLVSAALPLEDLMQVLDAEGKFDTVIPSLQKLVSSGDAGLELWPFAMVQVLGAQIDGIIQEGVRNWVITGDDTPLTQASLNIAKEDILDRVVNLDNFDLVPSKRCVPCACAGTDFILPLDTVTQQISIAFSFAWRPIAVRQGNLVPLFCQDVVIPNPRPLCNRPVMECLYNAPQAARKALNAEFKELGTLTGEQTVATMKRIMHNYMCTDPDFEADVQLVLAVHGANSSIRLLKACQLLLPTAEVEKDIETVAFQLSALSKDNVFKFAPKPSQVKFGIIKSVVCALVDKTCPDVTHLVSDPEMLSIYGGLAHFVRHEVPADAAGLAVCVTGLLAMQFKKKAIDAIAASGVVVTKKDVAEI